MKPGMTHYKKIFGDVEKRDIASLYLLQGPELFIMEEMAQRIVSSLVPADLRAFNLTIAYGSEMDAGAFVGAASAYPFLSDHRVLVLRELEKLRGGWKQLIEYCRSPVPTSVVIFLYRPFDEWGERLREPRDFAKLAETIGRGGRVISFERLPESDLRLWVRQKAKLLGFELAPDAADALIRSVGDNLFDLRSEITKLALRFEGRIVRKADLAAVMGGYRLNALAELIESIEPGGEASAMAMLERIMRTGAERPSSLLYHLARHFLTLLKIRTGAAAAAYLPERLRRASRQYGVREILVWLENVRRAELLLKTSSFPEEALLVGAFAHAFRGRCMDLSER